jgi:hypothetical protein
MKNLAVAVSLFVLAVAGVFAQKLDTINLYEVSNDFAEIKEAYQKRLYDASSEYNYFFHHLGGLVVNVD